MLGSSFLDIPADARRRIYAEAGRVRPCWIELGPRRQDPIGASRTSRLTPRSCFYRLKLNGLTTIIRARPDRICPRLPIGLLLVCIAIHNEAHAVFYGQNKFLLRGHSASDLDSLACVSSSALAAMNSLVLRLNCWPCPNGHDDTGFRSTRVQGTTPTCVNCGTPFSRGDAAWTDANPTTRELIPEWESLCNRLSSSVSAGKLRLTLICDVQDLASGKRIVRPLLSLPTLAACTIRLGRRRDQYDLTALAQETSLRLTGPYAPPQPGFRFEALPYELRRRILEFTHLGPRTDYARPLLRIEHGKLVLNNPVPISHPICCFKCTETFADCCCPTIHASYAPKCTCRVLPMELFLVSKRMYQDAGGVFYSSTTFDFAQDLQETLAFLERLPRRALRLIRCFRISFPRDHMLKWFRQGHADQFNKLVTFIRDNMDDTRLRLIVNTHTIDDDCQWEEDPDDNRYVYDTYLDIANTLCLLRGLRDVQFDLGWASELGPWLAREVLGDRSHYEAGKSQGDWFARIPHWHSNESRLPNSNYEGGS